MSRSLAVATAEFLLLVRTRFFIVSVLLVPVMIGVSIWISTYAERGIDREQHRVAVVDETGLIFPAIVRAAAEGQVQSSTPAAGAAAEADSADTTPLVPLNFAAEQVALAGRSLEDTELELSKEVHAKTLYAFIVIPAEILQPSGTERVIVNYYTENPSNRNVPGWLGYVINRQVESVRFASAGVNPAMAKSLSQTARVSLHGLVEKGTDGAVRPTREVSRWETFGLPFGMMYLMFLAIMMNAPHMMNAVIEEKMSRISEVLIASITPFQLLVGKLMGVAAVSVLLVIVYLGGGAYLAFETGQWDIVQLSLIPWFLIFLLCAVLMFGSIFIAVGAACSDLKDAQSMLQPAMFLMVMPILASGFILQAPNSPISVAMSLIPTATPFLMLARIAMQPPPPMWQVSLSIVLTIGTAALCVWAAGRIFRVGLLMQGKAPNLPELLKWIRA